MKHISEIMKEARNPLLRRVYLAMLQLKENDWKRIEYINILLDKEKSSKRTRR